MASGLHIICTTSTMSLPCCSLFTGSLLFGDLFNGLGRVKMLKWKLRNFWNRLFGFRTVSDVTYRLGDHMLFIHPNGRVLYGKLIGYGNEPLGRLYVIFCTPHGTVFTTGVERLRIPKKKDIMKIAALVPFQSTTQRLPSASRFTKSTRPPTPIPE